MPGKQTLYDRLYSRVRINTSSDDACWEWQAGIWGHGYGSFGRWNGKGYSAHQIAWIVEHGSIPDGMWVLHRCDNKRCVRPSHLFLGTRVDNVRDMETKGRSRHPKGKEHAFHLRPELPCRGERNGRAKLTTEQVIEIRAAAHEGASFKGLSRIYGVSDTQINWIVRRRSWKHVH